MALLWTVVTVLLAVLETVTTQFVSIWFAGGAFLALIAAIIGLGVWWQITVFVITSCILLLLTRPCIKRLREKGPEKTNSDAVIGMKVPVYAKICNVSSEGAVKIRDVVWSARSENGEDIDVGSIVEIVRIEGVKLIVKQTEV